MLTGIDGVAFENCQQHGIAEMYGGISMKFIGIDDLLKNKEASARAKDLIDLHELKKLSGKE